MIGKYDLKSAVIKKEGSAVIRPILGVIVVMFVFGLSLFLWKLVFDTGDWAVVALLPLFFMVYTGCYQVALRRRRAILLIALRSESYLVRILKGRFFSFVISFVIAVVATLVLAFEAITISFYELAVLTTLCLLALGLYKFFTVRLSSHFNDSFLPAFCTILSVVLSGLAMSPIYAWVELTYVSHPGYIRTLSFAEAIKETLEQSLTGGGITNEVLSIFYALDSAKLWFVVNAESLNWGTPHLLTTAYVLFDAAICFLVARAIVAVAAFFQFGLRNWRY